MRPFVAYSSEGKCQMHPQASLKSTNKKQMDLINPSKTTFKL